MSRKLGAPEAMIEDLRKKIKELEISLEVNIETDCNVTIKNGNNEKEQCGPATLITGGWITCPDAWELADKLEVPRKRMGELLASFDIKVRQCQLGCF